MNVPDALKQINLRPLFVMRLESIAPMVVGQTPGSFRRVGFVTGGSFESAIEGLGGKVLGCGNDWQTVREDGATTLDVRIVLETETGDRIAMTYPGIRHGTPEVIARLDRGEDVDPSEYYFRLAARFETSSQTFGWLNRIVAIGTGQRLPSGPVYSLFEVL